MLYTAVLFKYDTLISNYLSMEQNSTQNNNKNSLPLKKWREYTQVQVAIRVLWVAPKSGSGLSTKTIVKSRLQGLGPDSLMVVAPAQIRVYDTGNDELVASIPWIRRQPNCNDCGLYAIANMLDVIRRKFPYFASGQSHQFEFIKDEMSSFRQMLQQPAKDTFPKTKNEKPTPSWGCKKENQAALLQ